MEGYLEDALGVVSGRSAGNVGAQDLAEGGAEDIGIGVVECSVVVKVEGVETQFGFAGCPRSIQRNPRFR